MYLGNNPLAGSIPSTIFNNSMLQDIELGSSNLSGSLPSNLCRELPKIQVLYLSFNQLSGKMPSVWHHCKELTDVDLSNNRFSRGSIPADIGNLTTLGSLYLHEDNLEGEIPSSLFNISSLRVLSLQENKLNGSLTEEMFHQLPLLEVFSLADNQFVGSIPKSISNCTMLQELYLSDNSFAGSIPEEIGDLPILGTLSLGNNQLSGSIPSSIFNMSSLSYMSLANNSLSGFLPLHINLEDLEELNLSENQLGGKIPSSISNASKLNYVDLSVNKFNGVIPNALGNLGDLQWLEVAYNNLTTDASTIELSFLSSLNFLQISGNPMHGNLHKSIGNMSNLEQFIADACSIDGKIPLEIGNLSNLFILSLYQNDLSGPIPTTIKGLHSLQYLSLGNNQLQGTIIDELCVINRLSELYITENKLISGVIPACFGNLTSLRKLYLNSNKLNHVPSSLWSLKDILEVNLSDNALTAFLPLDIGNLKAVILLDISKNQISGSIPTAIAGLQNLQTLNLAHNKLQGNIPDSVGSLISLISLDLSQNYLFGMIPKSLESLHDLKFINLSYNRLEGEIPNGGPFTTFTAQSFIFNKALCGNAQLQVPPCRKMKRKRSNANLFFIKCILPIMLSTILVVLFVFLLIRRQRKNDGDPSEVSSSILPATRMISYNELSQATNGFDECNLLGKGSFGSVFKGILPNGMVVAVKLFNLDLELESKSFHAECEAMRNLRHRNLIKIITSCSNFDYKLLVMEFIPNGSLERWLYSHNYCLGFLQRLNIMIDVASALDYLHHGSSPTVVHCDVKPSNVLLDENMVAHVSDFGIAKLLDEGQSKEYTNTMATIGYIAPEYGSKGTISTKGDVYSFGIMLMETFTRKKPTDELFVAGLSMKGWISESSPHAITQFVDSNLLQDERIDDITASVSSIFRMALNCCADLPEERMNMTDVAASLNKIKFMFLKIND
ncbi:probable LRR receptor-like serine/threonine-protein kinase At3g47570 [Gastrolobium bilobum]|uniref:probable LRR receptor-like serine/threonine-protein kinase At3g47570 n=1 Tax=Gastrolobium bilobum TaxID=150636 RepID=UPI002AB2ED48|nr:probable LRR receptor-like serine/threonine-protein kinase At3g47570 [Gastrolobium bilobum]